MSMPLEVGKKYKYQGDVSVHTQICTLKVWSHLPLFGNIYGQNPVISRRKSTETIFLIYLVAFWNIFGIRISFSKL